MKSFAQKIMFLWILGRPLVTDALLESITASDMPSDTRDAVKEIIRKARQYEAALEGGAKQERAALLRMLGVDMAKLNMAAVTLDNYVKQTIVSKSVGILNQTKDAFEQLVAKRNKVQQDLIALKRPATSSSGSSEVTLQRGIETTEDSIHKKSREVQTQQEKVEAIRKRDELAERIRETPDDNTLIRERDTYSYLRAETLTQATRDLEDKNRDLEKLQKQLVEAKEKLEAFRADASKTQTTLGDQETEDARLSEEIAGFVGKNIDAMLENPSVAVAIKDAALVFNITEDRVKAIVTNEFKQQVLKVGVDKVGSSSVFGRELQENLSRETRNRTAMSDKDLKSSTVTQDKDFLSRKEQTQKPDIGSIVLNAAFPGEIEAHVGKTVGLEQINELNEKIEKSSAFDPDSNTIATRDGRKETLEVREDALRNYVCTESVNYFIKNFAKRSDSVSLWAKAIGQFKQKGFMKIKGMIAFVNALEESVTATLKVVVLFDTKESLGLGEDWNDTIVAVVLSAMRELFPSIAYQEVETHADASWSQFKNAGSERAITGSRIEVAEAKDKSSAADGGAVSKGGDDPLSKMVSGAIGGVKTEDPIVGALGKLFG